jgi:hypothetical protein
MEPAFQLLVVGILFSGIRLLSTEHYAILRVIIRMS